MKVLKRISSIILMSALISAMFLGTAVFASMPTGITPRATGQQYGLYSTLEGSCSTDSVSVKFTNNTSSSHYCEVIGYLKDSEGNDLNGSDNRGALYNSGNVSGGRSIADTMQRRDVYTIEASGNIYNGTSASSGTLEHLDLIIGR